MADYEKCKDALKKLYGLEPYNQASNINWNDNYFGYFIEHDYSKDMIAQAKKELGIRD